MPVCLGALLLLVLASCAPSPDAPRVDEDAARPESTVERGPVRLTARLGRDEIDVGEKLRLEIEVTAETDVEVRMPVVDDPLGPFAVRDARTPPDVPVGTDRRWVHTYTLDTFADGDLTVPSLIVTFTDARTDEPITGELATEPLAVHVRSVLREGEEETSLRPVRDAVELEVPVPPAVARRRWGLGVAAAVVLAIAAFLLWRRRRRRRRGPAAAPIIPPHVWARGELDRLVAEGHLERGEFHAFYVRLSDVVRQYVERRFRLMAPERTTEEFLREAGRSHALTLAQRELLGAFLRAADMVKFALHVPTHAEGAAALDAARAFVEETTVVETPPAGAPAREPRAVGPGGDDDDEVAA